MMKKRLWMGVMFLAVSTCLTAGVTLVDPIQFTYESELGGPTVSLYSDVAYDDASGLYTYTYKITNSPDLYINVFEVQLLEGATVTTVSDSYSGDNGTIPTLWLVADPAMNVMAVFLTPMIAPGGTSVTLWFESYQAPVIGLGAIEAQFDDDEREFICLCNELWTPVPEPATMALLVLGTGCMMRRKRN